MGSLVPRICQVLSAPALLLLLSSCTITDLLSSTTPGVWYTDDGLVRDEYKVLAFATLNFENVKQDMAQGHGEYLGSLARLLEIQPADQTEFFTFTQREYSVLIESERTTPGEMLSRLATMWPGQEGRATVDEARDPTS